VHNLGHTRSSRQADHLLLTSDTFIRAPLPGMKACTAIVHASPAIGAEFLQYTAEFEAGGQLGPTRAQRFLYVLDGSVSVESEGKKTQLSQRGYAFFPEGAAHGVASTVAAKLAVIEKPYERLESTAAPKAIVSSEDSVTGSALGGDPDLQVKCLLPDSSSFDCAVNTMTYNPGAALSLVEMHVMEHGLLMLEGGGIYRLGDAWYPVTAGDFIWMGPWCPQWFGALGKKPAKYLIYKNWNRHPLGKLQR
jgi:(S)-ureidoglycine aminohydrolase